MPAFVLDASVPLGALLPGETHAKAAGALLARAAAETAIVPVIWVIEIANAVLAAERRRRLDLVDAEAILRHLATLPLATDPETGRHAWTTTLALARRHRLTLYDACYLELAQRQGLELATFDAALARAALAEKVALAAPAP